MAELTDEQIREARAMLDEVERLRAEVERLKAERDSARECNEAMRAPMRRLREAVDTWAEGEDVVVDRVLYSLAAEKQRADSLAAALVCGATPYEDAPTHRCVYCDDEVTW